MWSRELILSLVTSLLLATPAFADELVASAEPALLPAAGAGDSADAPPPSPGTIRLAPGETYTIRTETTVVAKPSTGGLYVDCLPNLCAVETSGESPVPEINWEAVRSCCGQGNLQCFWVDASGRQAVTDDFFRCVSANTPASPYVTTTAAVDTTPTKKKQPAARRKPASAKRGS